jgi:hypothetical protein
MPTNPEHQSPTTEALIDAASALLSQWKRYLDSDLSQMNAHDILVRYELWNALDEALSRPSPDEPMLTAEEMDELVARINANPNLHPIAEPQDSDAARLLRLAQFLRAENLAAREVCDDLERIAARLEAPKMDAVVEARDAVIEAARLFLKEGTRVTSRGDGYFFQQVIEKPDRSYPHWQLCEAVEKLDAALHEKKG